MFFELVSKHFVYVSIYEVMSAKSRKHQALITKLGGWSEERQEFVGWRVAHAADRVEDMVFVNDLHNPQFTDNKHRCICNQSLEHPFSIVNEDETQHAIIGSTCIDWFPDEFRREYKDWRDEKAGVKVCIFCNKKMRTNHDGKAHERCRRAKARKEKKQRALYEDDEDIIDPQIETIRFGKYWGMTWAYVKENDPGYLRFVFSDKFQPYYARTRDCIEQLKNRTDW